MLTASGDINSKRVLKAIRFAPILMAGFIFLSPLQNSYAAETDTAPTYEDYREKLVHIKRSPKLVSAIEDVIDNLPPNTTITTEIELHIWKLVELAKLQQSEKAIEFASEIYAKYDRDVYASDEHYSYSMIQLIEYLVKTDELDFSYKIIQDLREKVYSSPNQLLSYTIDKGLIEVYIETYDYQRALDIALSVLNNDEYNKLETAQTDKNALINEIAFLYNRLGDGNNALTYLDHALDSFNDDNLTKKQRLKAHARHSGNRARAMLLLGNYEETAKLGQIALDGGLKLNEAYMIALGYRLTGSAAFHMGENEKALNTLKAGINLAQKHNLIVMKAPLYLDYSLALEKEGEYEEALHWKSKLYQLQSDVHASNTATQRRLNDVEFKALKSYQEVVELRKENEAQRQLSEHDNKVKQLLIITILSLLTVGLGLAVLIANNLRTRKKLLESEQKAQSANNAKSDFLATMSHEIRTPMNGVLGMAQVLEGTNLSEEQRSYLDIMCRSGENLLAIINDILDFSKLDADKMTIHKEPNDLDQTLHDVVALLSPRAIKKSIALNYHYESSLPKSLIYDDHRIRQVVTNLIGNAIKFTSEGQVDVSVVGSVDKQKNLAEVQIRIADSGIGISKVKQSLIFEKFTQAESSTTRNYGGTGLGLAISRKLIEAMDGQLAVESELGKGSTFIINIEFGMASALPMATESEAISSTTVNETQTPVEQAEKQPFEAEATHKTVNVTAAKKPAPEAKPVPAANPEQTAKSNKLQILIVEDNDINQTVLKTMLSHPQINLTLANNGEEALEAYEKQTFNLILMDVSMPVMDGKTATKLIRAKEAVGGRTRTPIICLTAHAMQKHKQEFLDVGMDDYLTKPIKKAQLLKLMKAWLQPQAQKAA